MLTVLATQILHLIVGTERVVHVRKHKIMETMSCFLFKSRPFARRETVEL